MFLIESLDWKAERKRWFYACPSLYNFLTRPATTSHGDEQRRKLQALLDRFASGDGVSIKFFDEEATRGSDIARLTPARDNVWEFRAATASPQLRTFGRFAKTDVFVAFIGPIERGEYRRWKDYEGDIRAVQQEWLNLFLDYPADLGSEISDYISTNVLPLRSPRPKRANSK